MEKETDTGNTNLLTVDIKSFDKQGNLKEHIRIHEDGKEETIFEGT